MSSKKITKLNEFFYTTSEGDILKYKKYCIINNCKKLSSYNYSGEKENLYCNDHKLDKMVNVRKSYSYCNKHDKPYLKFCKECEKFDCLLCDETVNKSHYFSKKHIDKVNNNISIKIRTSIKKKFIDIIIDFHIIDKMVNVRKSYSYCNKHDKPYLKFCKECEKFDCLLCDETVNKSHYFSKKYIDKVNNNISIKIRTSIKKKFIDIIIDFHIIDKDIFYKDLYFKDKLKSLILKHRNKDKIIK